MKAAQELLWGLFRMGLVAAGVFYAAEVVITYAKSQGFNRPAFDPNHRLRSAGELLVWAGVETLRLAIKLTRPLLNMLSEASAEVGEWALARRHAAAPIRTRVR